MTYIDDEFHVTWFTPFIIGYWCYFKNQTKTKNYQLNKAQQPVPKLPISPLSLYQKLVINYHVIIRSYYSSLRASFFFVMPVEHIWRTVRKTGFSRRNANPVRFTQSHQVQITKLGSYHSISSRREINLQTLLELGNLYSKILYILYTLFWRTNRIKFLTDSVFCFYFLEP